MNPIRGIPDHFGLIRINPPDRNAETLVFGTEFKRALRKEEAVAVALCDPQGCGKIFGSEGDGAGALIRALILLDHKVQLALGRIRPGAGRRNDPAPGGIRSGRPGTVGHIFHRPRSGIRVERDAFLQEPDIRPRLFLAAGQAKKDAEEDGEVASHGLIVG